MEEIILEIIAFLRTNEDNREKDLKGIEKILRAHNRKAHAQTRAYSKKQLMPYVLKARETDPLRYQSWNLDTALERRLFSLLQIKPRRSASGVATITVITKPQKCSSDCIYCPNDLRMPKSYMHNEPACQRAERNYFDPYLQVARRLQTLHDMGHTTDKIELIVLGGSFSDYSPAYQRWFIAELFRALNDAAEPSLIGAETTAREAFYERCGLSTDTEVLEAQCAALQNRISSGELNYNQAWDARYATDPAWQALDALIQSETKDLSTGENAQAGTANPTPPRLQALHQANESAQHRCVGLVVETRPDLISLRNLTLLRALGCTKIQMGIQSLDEDILKKNGRKVSCAQIQNAFELCRLFGFKTHAHFMLNLLGATPKEDAQGFYQLVHEAPYQPDEIKLYPCALIADTQLCTHYEQGSWQPYPENELVDLLVQNLSDTPPYTRISRMIRDFSAGDIVAGNKKINLRQLVEEKARSQETAVREIRFREPGCERINPEELRLTEHHYITSNTTEYFLEWQDNAHTIAGFLRLSLPYEGYIESLKDPITHLPFGPREAMIREVHVYGAVAALHQNSAGAQHLGLGKKLIARACAIAREAGYLHLNVISAIGTRAYYRSLGFEDAGLYQRKDLYKEG